MNLLRNIDTTHRIVIASLACNKTKFNDIFFAVKSGVDDDLLWCIANENRVKAIVAHLLKDLPGLEVKEKWILAHKNNTERLNSYLAELDQISTFFKEDNIQIIALKNAGIARGIYPCVGCCPMGDIDVLVRPKDFRNAHKILVENGYKIDTRCELEEATLEDAERTGGAEYTKLLPNGETLWFELQWRPVAGRWINPDQEPSADALVERSIPIDGTDVRLLSPEDNLLQVSLHTAKHTYVRAPGIRLHTDVDRIVKYQEINWHKFVGNVKKLHVTTAVYFSLKIPNVLFQTEIPLHVFKELRPPRWKVVIIEKWLQKVGLFNPDERKFGKIGYIVFNCLLYDSLGDFLKGVLPSQKWLKNHYKFENNFLLPYYYMKRIANLAFRRVL